jgi:hypothetical protein
MEARGTVITVRMIEGRDKTSMVHDWQMITSWTLLVHAINVLVTLETFILSWTIFPCCVAGSYERTKESFRSVPRMERELNIKAKIWCTIAGCPAPNRTRHFRALLNFLQFVSVA